MKSKPVFPNLPNIMQELTDSGWSARSAYDAERLARLAHRQGYMSCLQELLAAVKVDSSEMSIFKFLEEKIKTLRDFNL